MTSTGTRSSTSPGRSPPPGTRSRGRGGAGRSSTPPTPGVRGGLPETPPAEIADKCGRARRAQARWATVPLAERLAAVRRFRDLLVAQKGELALTLTREMG